MRDDRSGDEVYLSVHDFDADRPLIRTPRLRVIVIGGLLAELVLTDKATVDGQRLVITDARPSTDPFLHRMLAEILIRAPNERVLPYFLRILGQQAVDWIAARLVGAGILSPTSARHRLTDIGLGHAPTQHGSGRWPSARVAWALNHGAVLDDHARCLAAPGQKQFAQ